MKKIISILLVLVMSLSLLASCDIFPSTEDDDTPTLANAVQYFHDIYKDKSEITVADYDVVAQVKLKGVTFPVTWTCSDDRITIKESSKAGYYTVDLPATNEEEFNYTLTATISDADGNSEQKSYTFKMLVVDNSAVVTELKADVAYKMFLTQISYSQRLYALTTTQNNENKFINTTNVPTDAADFYAEAVEGGYKIYTLVNGTTTYVYANAVLNESTGKMSKYIGFSTEEGTVFTYDADLGGVWTATIEGVKYGVGTYGTYKTICLSEATYYSASTVGTTQFVLQFVTSEYANTLTPDEEPAAPELPAANSTLTIPEAIEVGESVIDYTTDKYYVTGTIKEVYNTTHGNMYIKDEAGNEFTVYGTYDATGENRYDAMSGAPVAGDTITVYGVLGNYNGTAQMKNGWIVSINGEDLGGGNAVALVPEKVLNPAVDTAYKLYMYQGKKAENYYFKGGMDGFYFATSTATNDAVDVYLETATGGYYIYYLDGSTKTYISAYEYQTGKVGVQYTTTASSVFTVDATTGILYTVVSLDGTDTSCYLGTYGDFTTINASKASYISDASTIDVSQHVVRLCTLVEDDNEPETPSEPSEPETVTTSTIATIIAGEAGKYQAEGVVVGIYARGFLVQDATGTMLVYKGTACTDVSIGSKVTVLGTTSAYGGAMQFTDDSTYTVNGTETLTPPTAAELSATDCDAYLTAEGVTISYVKVTGTLGISGNYYNLVIDGATIVGSIAYPTDEDKATLALLDGEEITVYGYVIGVTGSSTKYLNLMVDELEHDVDLHAHEYTSEVTTEATCTTAGVKTYTCECGDSYTEAIAQTAHNYENNACTVCGATVTKSDDFNTIAKDSSYTTVNPKTSASGWVLTNAQVINSTHTSNGSDFTALADYHAAVINGKTSAVGTIVSPTLSGGTSAISFSYANFYAENNGVDITISITYTENGETKTVSHQLDDDTVEKNVAETYTWTLDAAIEGDFVITITNNSPSNSTSNKDRVAIWHITW